MGQQRVRAVGETGGEERGIAVVWWTRGCGRAIAVFPREAARGEELVCSANDRRRRLR